MDKRFVTLYVTIFCMYISPFHGHINRLITLFIKPYPHIEHQVHKKSATLSAPLQQPVFTQKAPHETVKPPVSGIPARYLGFTTISDMHGQLVFPRKQISNSINLIITQALKPVFMVGSTTIHHWEYDKNNHDIAIYSMQLIFDEPTQLYYIKTTKEDRKKISPEVSFNSIIIYAHPDDIFVPEGATIVQYTPNLTLPDIYLTKASSMAHNNVNNISSKQYYEQVATQQHRHGNTIAKHLIN